MANTLPSVDVVGLVLEVVQMKPAFKVGHLADVPLAPTTTALVWLEEADESLTLGQVAARHGLDVGDSIILRFPTVAEDAARLAKLLDQARRGGPNTMTAPNGACLALREPDGQIVGSPDESWEDEPAAEVQ